MKSLFNAMIQFCRNTARSDKAPGNFSDKGAIKNDVISAIDEAEMRKWFNSTYGKDISREEAEGLVHSKRKGSFMTEIDRVLKARTAAKAM